MSLRVSRREKQAAYPCGPRGKRARFRRFRIRHPFFTRKLIRIFVKNVKNAAPDAPRPPVYDRLARVYDRATRPLERLGLARLRAETLGALPERGSLLEIGAGTGANFPFYPRGARVCASELSGEMLKAASVKRGGARAEVTLMRCRAEALPFADASFDAACATLVFCSVESPAGAFAELRRVVRPGGTVALLEHVRPPDPLGYLFDALSLVTVPLLEDHFNRHTLEDARRAGLEIVRVRRRLLGVVQTIVCRVPR
ncbi:MAG TPA: class I SAM-dependent methyltransferase [Pyrinomonadaceae bacterium]|nr:class I SAM-dependent methyltransferase [Pyrinomonadaceae bacterium]